MAAAILAQFHHSLAAPLLWVIQPLAAWIRFVADTGAHFPASTIQARPATVAVVYGWILAGFIAEKPRITIAAAAVVVGVAMTGEKSVDVDKRNAYVVEREADIGPLPPGTTVVVVREAVKHDRPVVTQEGIPVIYPYNDQHD